MRILDRDIGFGKPTYFIADIAANHDGDLSRALRLIELASEAGADCVKFQHHDVRFYVSDKGFKDLGGKFSHQSSWSKSIYEVYKDAEVSVDWTPLLVEHATEHGVHFMSTPYTLDMVDHLDPYVPAFKIGSGDINYHAMLRKVASKGKPIIISTGASTTDEITDAVRVLLKGGLDESQIAVLQCNTNYTADDTNFDYINLNVLKSIELVHPCFLTEEYNAKLNKMERVYKNSIRVPTGLSDHTHGHVTVLGAVALGACMVEKHFTDDTSREGPDHSFSMTPETWRAMVDDTRKLERAMGITAKTVQENEQETVILQRRSARVTRDISRGSAITAGDVVYQRPCPKDAMDINVVERVLARQTIVSPVDLKEGDYLTRIHFQEMFA